MTKDYLSDRLPCLYYCRTHTHLSALQMEQTPPEECLNPSLGG